MGAAFLTRWCFLLWENSVPMIFAEHSPWAWIAFTALILGILALDLGVFHRKPAVIPIREALWMAAGYIVLALLFNVWVYYSSGYTQAIQFLTGYFVEKALSMDNIMVFVVIFSYFQVPAQHQMRVLLWGILGALVLRAIFIMAGLALIKEFEWTMLIMGLFLIYTGIKTMFSGDEAIDLEHSRIIKITRKVFPVTHQYSGERFFVRGPSHRWVATPLFVVLVVMNITDIIFALDSIPAVFGITQDPFIVFSSNVFAVLGLRALYFALAGMVDRFRYLKFGLALVLIFIGLKMAYNYLPWPDIPTSWALIVTAILIFGSILASVVQNWREDKKGGETSLH
jgi:tellurite resistance protein TerC